MLAEFVLIALTIHLLLCGYREDRSAYGMSFETLLIATISAILLTLPNRYFCIIQDVTYFQIIRPNLFNYRLRELPICTKICTKAASFVLLPFCLGSAFIS